MTLLLENGADVNARDKRENSATFAAIQENNPGVLKIILDAGGDRLIDSELDRFEGEMEYFLSFFVNRWLESWFYYSQC